MFHTSYITRLLLSVSLFCFLPFFFISIFSSTLRTFSTPLEQVSLVLQRWATYTHWPKQCTPTQNSPTTPLSFCKNSTEDKNNIVANAAISIVRLYYVRLCVSVQNAWRRVCETPEAIALLKALGKVFISIWHVLCYNVTVGTARNIPRYVALCCKLTFVSYKYLWFVYGLTHLSLVHFIFLALSRTFVNSFCMAHRQTIIHFLHSGKEQSDNKTHLNRDFLITIH